MKRIAVERSSEGGGLSGAETQADTALEMSNLFSGTILPAIAALIIVVFLIHQFVRWAIANGMFERERDTGLN